MDSTENNRISVPDELYHIADTLRGIANQGLRFCENGYDKERYEQVLHASARLVAAVENRTEAEIYAQYEGNLAHLSPLIGAEAAVFRGGKILLVQRRDNGLWVMPGGLTEVGESPAQSAERELWEEAGMRGKAARMLALFDTRFWPSKTRTQLFITLFLVETEDAPFIRPETEEGPSPHAESLDAGFFDLDHLPNLFAGHTLRVPLAFKLYNGELPAPYFDR